MTGLLPGGQNFNRKTLNLFKLIFNQQNSSNLLNYQYNLKKFTHILCPNYSHCYIQKMHFIKIFSNLTFPNLFSLFNTMLTTQMDIKPFLHKKVVIVSEEWLSFCAYSRVFANLVQWFTYLMLLYVIVKSSPRVMGSYRWYIIWNVTHGILLSSYAVLMQPYPLTPYTIIVMRGLFKWIEVRSFGK